jgi:hypothetical protein
VPLVGGRPVLAPELLSFNAMASRPVDIPILGQDEAFGVYGGLWKGMTVQDNHATWQTFHKLIQVLNYEKEN